jgi:hypothetical protein
LVDVAVDLSLNALANLAVAIGTIILAVVTYKVLTESRKQLSVLTAQTVISRSQVDPYLLVRSFNFKGDKLVVDVENIGKGHATWLSVRLWFQPCEPHYYADKHGEIPLTQEQAAHLGKAQGWALGKYEPSHKVLKYKNWKEAFTVQTFTFLGNESVGDEAVLLAGERQQFQIEPYFCIGKDKSPFTEGKGFKFDEFRQFLAANDLHFLAVEFQLASKDPVENNLPGVPICKFVIDLANHKTVEEAFVAKLSFDFFPLSQREPAQKYGFMPSAMYYETKSGHNAPRPWEED